MGLVSACAERRLESKLANDYFLEEKAILIATCILACHGICTLLSYTEAWKQEHDYVNLN